MFPSPKTAFLRQSSLGLIWCRFFLLCLLKDPEHLCFFYFHCLFCCSSFFLDSFWNVHTITTHASNPQPRNSAGRGHSAHTQAVWDTMSDGDDSMFLWVSELIPQHDASPFLTRGERRSCHAPADWIIISLLSPFCQGQSRSPITALDQAIFLFLSFLLCSSASHGRGAAEPVGAD